jgi:lipoyl(octanoyl) transferase
MAFERHDQLARPLLEVYLLGLLDYEDALRLQRRFVYEVSGAHGELGALILCEHPPTISVGRQGSRAHIECDDEELACRNIRVRWVNRGGGCNLHVPGQLVAYPILPFQPGKSAIRDYVGRLETSLLGVLDEFGVRASRRPGHSGLWTPAGQIAALGIAVSRWVTYHGMTLNVAGVRDPYRILHPTGNGPLRVTTIEAERQRPAPMSRVRESLIRHFTAVFELDRFHLYSHHPTLTRQEPAHAYARSV